ncbi:MAG: DUF433 domain-containing protein [Chloroflexota bacterium]|nr:DUF433 domain-containing protein [Chloroflexota bacterium]
MNWQDCPAVEQHPDVVSGAWVFKGTRVPVHALFENVEDGATVKQFVKWFDGVEEWHVKAVWEHEATQLQKERAR